MDDRSHDLAPRGARLLALAGTLLVCTACGDHAGPSATPPPTEGIAPDTAVTTTSESPAATNGCLENDWVDRSGVTAVEIVFGGEAGRNYVPRCVKVDSGAAIRFIGPFETHPFVGGNVVAGRPIPSPGASRFAPVARGDGAEFQIEEPGDYGYYCDRHAGEGMFGAVRVVPR